MHHWHAHSGRANCRDAANGDAIEDLLTEYPSLQRADILACLEYAATLAEEEITPLELVETIA